MGILLGEGQLLLPAFSREVRMVHPRLAVHRSILVVDVEGFGDQRRTNSHQVVVRTGLYRAVESAFGAAGIPWGRCYHEDRGDSVFVLTPPDVPKGPFVDSLPYALIEALHEHNRRHRAEEQIRLRAALHAGEINYDDHGVTAAAITLAFRLAEARPLKAALAESPGVLALIVSSWFFDEVVRHSTGSDPAIYRRVWVTVKETSTVGWICLPDHPYPPLDPSIRQAEPGLPVPRQLPVATSHFAGRVAELDMLTSLMEGAAGLGGTLVISAIDGTAGIGKTALAVQWAHQVADRFPDGQLYVNLRGFDPTGLVMTPAEAVRGFLDAFGVPPERIPLSFDGQASLFRSLVVGRQLLVVLDNARNADQVRPLLPGSPSCLVIVTSRNRLTSLITVEGARPLTLDLLDPDEARQLLRHRLGSERINAEPRAVAEIVALCARLPLALSIVAARAATHPTFPLATLASELREARGDLGVFDGGDNAANVRTVFSWSYQQLSPEAARLFRQLGVHPGPDITPPAAANLAGISVRQVLLVLAELDRAHLVKEHNPGRFAFHDLLRSYAGEQAHAVDTETERHTTMCRMLDHYLHTAQAAAVLLHPRRRSIALAAHRPEVTPESFTDLASALAWFEIEHSVLLAAVQSAAAKHHVYAWQLPWTLGEFFERRGHWHDNVATNHIALTATIEHADRCGQAYAHRGLGRAYPWLGRYEDALTHLRLALHLLEELGDQIGQAYTYLELSWMFEHRDRHEDALFHGQRALVLFNASDDRPGRAAALYRIAHNRIMLGDHQEAFVCCQQALTLCQELGDRRGESHALSVLGYTHNTIGNHREAIACYHRSLRLHRELGDRYHEANLVARLADAYYATGDHAAAREAWQRALPILENLGNLLGPSRGFPDVHQIRAKLHQYRPT